MRRLKAIEFACDNYYHIFNRGTDKREIFMDDEDRLRFLHDMYEFNSKEKAIPYMNRKKNDTIGCPTSIGSRTSNSTLQLR